MKDIDGKIVYKEHEYKIVFNFNVMEQIQEEYGTLDKWGELTDGVGGEINVKAVIFGAMCMLNEGIDIENEENGTDIKPLTKKQVGRIISEVGIAQATEKINDVVIESSKSDEKNA